MSITTEKLLEVLDNLNVSDKSYQTQISDISNNKQITFSK